MLRSNFRQLIRTTLGYSMNTLVGPIFTLLLFGFVTIERGRSLGRCATHEAPCALRPRVAIAPREDDRADDAIGDRDLDAGEDGR